MPTHRIFLVLSFLGPLCFSSSFAAECIDYAQVPVPVGSIPFGLSVWDVDVESGFACVVSWDRLFVVDITQPANPTQVAAIDLPATGMCIAISGSLAYVGTYTGISIIDVGAPSAPVVLGHLEMNATVLDIDVGSSFLYAAGSSGLLVIDVTDPSKPNQAGSVSIRNASGVFLQGETAFVAAGNLYAVDVRDPGAPTILGLSILGDACDLTVSKGCAYVASYYYGLTLVDISDPTRLTVLGSIDTPGVCYDVEVVESIAYVVDESGSGSFPSALRAIDVHNSALPRLVGAVDLPGRTRGLAIAGSFAYVTSDRTLQVVDLQGFVSCAILGQIDTSGLATAVAASGDFVYVGTWDSGVHVLDVRDPLMPRIVGSVETPGVAADIVVSGTHAYVAAEDRGLQVVDVGTPTAPTLVASLDTPGLTVRLALEGDYLYVADQASLLVVDITTPSSPLLVGSLEIPGVTDVDVAGDYAYVGIGERLYVVRITDPAVPRSVNYLPLPWFVDDIQITNGRAYVANGLGGFLVLDLRNPFAPVVLGSYRTGLRMAGVEVAGGLAYLIDSYGLRVFDVVQPASPALLGSYVLSHPRDILLHAGVIYVPDLSSGLFLLRPQCRPTAVTLDDFGLEYDGEAVVARWRCASVPAPAFRLVASSAADSWNVPIQSVGSGGWEARDRFPSLRRLGAADYRLFAREPGEDWVVLAQQSISLSAFPEHRTHLSVFPNPFTGEGRIRYEIGAPQQLRVSVHEVSGRLVRRLVDGPVATNRGEIIWDGRDPNGRAVAAGVYIVRLESAKIQRSLKLVLTR